ncbi:unnamed protein product [Coregonus sp. 'balchen']|nr:unnamed protein product [Coregonus sp. 'balchen']
MMPVAGQDIQQHISRSVVRSWNARARHYFTNIYSFWLTRVGADGSLSPSTSQGTLKEEWQQWLNVGWCNVCMKE